MSLPRQAPFKGWAPLYGLFIGHPCPLFPTLPRRGPQEHARRKRGYGSRVFPVSYNRSCAAHWYSSHSVRRVQMFTEKSFLKTLSNCRNRIVIGILHAAPVYRGSPVRPDLWHPRTPIDQEVDSYEDPERSGRSEAPLQERCEPCGGRA